MQKGGIPTAGLNPTQKNRVNTIFEWFSSMATREELAALSPSATDLGGARCPLLHTSRPPPSSANFTSRFFVRIIAARLDTLVKARFAKLYSDNWEARKEKGARTQKVPLSLQAAKGPLTSTALSTAIEKLGSHRTGLFEPAVSLVQLTLVFCSGLMDSQVSCLRA